MVAITKSGLVSPYPVDTYLKPFSYKFIKINVSEALKINCARNERPINSLIGVVEVSAEYKT